MSSTGFEQQSGDYKTHQLENCNWILVTSPWSEKHLILRYFHVKKLLN